MTLETSYHRIYYKTDQLFLNTVNAVFYLLQVFCIRMNYFQQHVYSGNREEIKKFKVSGTHSAQVNNKYHK